MTQTQTARALAEAYGFDPDEWIVRWPASSPIPAWTHFMPLAEITDVWLRQQAKVPPDPQAPD